VSTAHHVDDVSSMESARFKSFTRIGAAVAFIGIPFGLAFGNLGISVTAGLIVVLMILSYVWTTQGSNRTLAGFKISLYGAALGLALMSFLELPEAATLPFFMALVILAGSYLLGVRQALYLTIVASLGVITCYLGFAWAANAGLVPDTGSALFGTADIAELSLMAGLRVIFLFAIFGIAAAARRALDDQLQVVQDREQVIVSQGELLRDSEDHFLTVAENVPVGILETDNDGAGVFANEAWCQLVMMFGDSALGDSWRASLDSEDIDKVLQMFADVSAVAKTGQPIERVECVVRIRRSNGELRWVTCHATPLFARDSSLKGHVLSAVDVTSQRAASEQLKYLATRDPLTGVLNRSYFELEVSAALARSARYNARSALLFIDIDNFKLINDTYGHGIGDLALDWVARRIQTTVRGVDLIGRLGGDEFGVLMDQVQTREDAELKIRHIHAVFTEPLAVDGDTTLDLRLSIGAAVYPEDGLTYQELSHVADTAMYAEKNHKSNSLHKVEDLKDRHVQGNQHGPNHAADYRNHDRLD
jgi:diguanylate cyclase (GGDEF)-like protein/PAS domain S-box-containing protein